MQPTIILYTNSVCPLCKQAKTLLLEKGMTFTEKEISGDPVLTEEMIFRSAGGTTVPQIFIDNRHIGGARELFALDAAGVLDSLLAIYETA